jgi:hypothetical protein
VATPVCPGGPPRGRAVTDRVVEVHALGCSRVRKAAGWHPEEHGLPDPSRNFVTVDCWDVLRIDDQLDCHIAAGVAQKAADLAECDGSDAFQAANSAGDAEFAVVVAEQCFFAEMDVQHYPRAEFG